MSTGELFNFRDPEDLHRRVWGRAGLNGLAVTLSTAVVGALGLYAYIGIKKMPSPNRSGLTNVSASEAPPTDCDLGQKPIEVELTDTNDVLLIARTTHEIPDFDAEQSSQEIGRYACVGYRPERKPGDDRDRTMTLTVYSVPTSSDAGIYSDHAGGLPALANTSFILRAGDDDSRSMYKVNIPANKGNGKVVKTGIKIDEL